MEETVVEGRVFAGRSDLLKDIGNEMERVETGKETLLLIAGAKGMGKSALLEKMVEMARSREWVTMHGSCQFAHAETPFAPIIEAIEGHLASRSAGDMEDQGFTPMGLGLMKGQVGEDRNEDIFTRDLLMERERMFENIEDIIRDMTDRSPVLITLDDLHWTSEATVHLLFYLVRSLRSNRVMFAATLDSKKATEWASERFLEVKLRFERDGLLRDLRLGPMDLEQTGEMLETITGATMDSAVVEIMHRTTEGNPFFIEEYMRTLLEQGIMVKGKGTVQDFGAMDIHTPSSIRNLVRSRLKGLGRTELRVAEFGTVIGQEFPFQTVIDATGLEEIDAVEAVDNLLKKGLLEEFLKGHEIHFRFTDNLTREIIYDDFSITKRRHTHKKVGETLEKEQHGKRGEDVYALSYHFLMAGEPVKAFEYSVKAGEMALRSYAFDEASGYFEKAHNMARLMEAQGKALAKDSRIRPLKGLARLSMLIGDWQRALRFYDEVASSEAGPKDRAWAYCEIGMLETDRTEWEKAMEAYTTAFRISGAIGDERGMVDALRGLGRIQWRTGNIDELNRTLEAALSKAKDINDRERVASCYSDIAAIHGILKGDIALSMKYLDLAENVLGDVPNHILLAKIMNNKGDLLMRSGRFDEALKVFKKGKEVAERIGYLRLKAYSPCNIGECLMMTGEFEKAMPHIDEALEMFIKVDDRKMVSHCHQCRGVIAKELGDWAGSERDFLAALAIQEEKKLLADLATTHLEYGRMLAKRGDLDDAKAHLKEARALFDGLENRDKVVTVEHEMEGL